MADELFHSPLHERHERLGARFAEFGGWSMPLEYAGGGVLKEHAAVRESVGIFDVSHLGKARVTGPGAADFVNSCLSNDLRKIEPGKAQYTLCVDDATGGVVDDMIAYLYGDDDVFLIPNAANTAEVVRRLAAAAPSDVEIVDQHHDLAILAVQGPKSREVMSDVGLPVDHEFMSFVDADVAGTTVVVCRTGYTGERGYELVVPAASAGAVWDRLLAAGEQYEMRPCGLGSRDTLRTEMGYSLHGQDISMDITPVEGRLGFAVGWKKDSFWGDSILRKEREAGPRRLLRGIKSVGRGIPRARMEVLGSDGRVVGVVTSGTFSPTLRQGIGLALLDMSVAAGDEVSIDVRGRSEAFEVAKPPFVDPAARD